IIVIDDDREQLGQPVVKEFSERAVLPVTYRCEPRRNIALARNLAIALGKGDFVAFIDDDEFPVNNWLHSLLSVAQEHAVAGVLGPVRPHFDQAPPRWLVKGKFCERPEHQTGTKMPGDRCRTGNVLLRRTLFPEDTVPFDPKFASGGEDKDFFIRMS